ncbi:MAG TPA: TIGR04190 family B12-binding domain/radical SAM domain protein [Anaerolineae bacterium]|nr:TIGR04190 family B12-binding domain/radical SAM domain protein [Anaerolineae bacterium]
MPQANLVLLHAPSVYDFRKESILYGPVSDLVPSTPVFEMYPIGLTTIAEYLERRGLRVRIVNLAVRMLNSARFDAEKMIRSLRPAVFGIDLHWMPHAHGAIEVARLCKKHHPDIPVMMGGFSATYFHEELIRRPEVDFVVRGDSTEEPVYQLMRHLTHAPGAPDLAEIPNLTWRGPDGTIHVNELTYSPENLDHVLIDYSYVVKAVARYRDLASFVPFKGWLGYPITAALTVRGCTHNCRTCGGSATAFANLHNRRRPAYRAPEALAQDIRNIARFSRGPVFILGDIRQPGEEYADRFLRAMEGYEGPVIVELFDAADRAFIQRLARTMPNWTLEVSLESHSDEVRGAFGRPYKSAAIEETMRYALEAGVRRLDVFFMIGLPKQDYDSVMGTVDYCEHLMRDLDQGSGHRLIPFVSPLAPFVDPGSPVFEQPERFGYRLSARTLEEHRQKLVQPSWKYVLNYETEWMDRSQIVDSTYEAGLRLNRLKTTFGVADPEQAAQTEARILWARRLITQVDDIVSIRDEGRRARLLRAIKPQVDQANLSTVCEKSELTVPLRGLKLNLPQAAGIFLKHLFSPSPSQEPALSGAKEPALSGAKELALSGAKELALSGAKGEGKGEGAPRAANLEDRTNIE